MQQQHATARHSNDVMASHSQHPVRSFLLFCFSRQGWLVQQPDTATTSRHHSGSIGQQARRLCTAPRQSKDLITFHSVMWQAKRICPAARHSNDLTASQGEHHAAGKAALPNYQHDYCCPQPPTENMVLVDRADLSMPEGEAVLPVLRLVGTKQDAHCGRLRPVALPLCPLTRLSYSRTASQQIKKHAIQEFGQGVFVNQRRCQMGYPMIGESCVMAC